MKNALLYLFFVTCSCTAIDESQKKTPQKSDPLSLGKRFVDEGDFRRTLLIDSFVNPENGYSQLRSQHYGPGKRWEELEVWNPDVRHLTDTDDDRPFEPFPNIDFETIDETELRAIGKAAFEGFPLSIDLQIQSHIQTPESVGLWKSDSRIGGLVEVSLPSGTLIAATCSTCHASVKDGKLTYGRANAAYQYGRIIGSDWRHGTMDVTPDGLDNPTSIPDIRPIRFQKYLHWTASLKNSLGALAVRIETLFITSLSQRLRPPRDIVFAIAYYFWTLGEDATVMTKIRASEEPGFKHFQTHCISCHLLDGSTASPIVLEAIGTEQTVGRSSRGTGKYRIPSLVGVSTRGQFLHDASVESLEALLLPERLEKSPGHLFGLSLNETERRALLDFLELL